jgi:hypothetical protein
MNVKRIVGVIGALAVVAACAPPKPPGPTAEELRNDPARTKEIMRQCREQRDQVSDETCAAARVAARAQFMGSGTTKYTPGGVETKPADESR